VPQFTDADAVLVGLARDAGILDGTGGPDLMRVVGGALDRIAEACVASYVQGTEEELSVRGASQLEHAQENERAIELADGLGSALGVVFRHHLRQAILRQRTSQVGVSRRELARLAIGFVDLVASTEATRRLEPAALAASVSQFENLAFDVATVHGGRVVKFIGDEIMISALDPEVGSELVLALVEAFAAANLEPRGGLACGEVLFRHGDYYGPVVNLASRLVDTAIPGEVLVDESVVAAAGDVPGLVFKPSGRRLLKGFDPAVSVWALERLS
jgi:class 3 adenylate cyclase